MSNFANFLEEKLLGHTLLGSVYTSPVTVYLSLATSLASDGDSFTEVTTNLGYARQLLHGALTEPTSANDFTVANSSNITFASATTPWGIVTHFAIHDADAIGGGNMLYFALLTDARDVKFNDVLQFQSGTLTVRLD